MAKRELVSKRPVHSGRMLMSAAVLLVLSTAGISSVTAASSGAAIDNERIASLLASARAALTAGRLSVPVDRCAVSYAQRILDVQPDHPDAIAVLQQVVDRYEALSRDRLDKGEAALLNQVREARRLQQRGLVVSQRHGLQAEKLRRLDAAVSRVESRGLAGGSGQVKSNVEAAAQLADAYLTRGETALHAGDQIAARRSIAVANQIFSDYKGDFAALSMATTLNRRLDTAIAAAWGNTGIAGDRSDAVPGTKGAVAPVVVEQWPSVFIPPAF